MLIYGGDVYTPAGVIPDGAVLVNGTRISMVGTRTEVIEHRSSGDATGPEVDAGGGIIAPGFIDLQVNGAGGGCCRRSRQSIPSCHVCCVAPVWLHRVSADDRNLFHGTHH